MVLKILNGFAETEGEPVELAMYTHTLLEIFRMKAEFDENKRDQEFLKKFGDFSLSDLMKMETEDKNEEDNNHDGA